MRGRRAGVLRVLRRELERDPENTGLRAHVADLLLEEGDGEAAAVTLRGGIDRTPGRADVELVRRLVPILRRAGLGAEALIRAEEALGRRDDPSVRLELARLLLERGDREGAEREYRRVLEREPERLDGELDRLLGRRRATEGEGGEPDSGWADAIDWDELPGGIESAPGHQYVRGELHLRVAAPLKSAAAAGRRSEGGGGLLLYGPLGCGKSRLARAAAHEGGARFLRTSPEDLVARAWGGDERVVAGWIAAARAVAPAVLYLEGLDRLGGGARDLPASFWDRVVLDLAAGLDDVRGEAGLRVIASAEFPWRAPPRLREPGRLAHALFVPPPDRGARERLLRSRLGRLPGGDRIELPPLIDRTSLLTLRELRSLFERVTARLEERGERWGRVAVVRERDLRRELRKARSATRGWLRDARGWFPAARAGGRHEDLEEFLARVDGW